MARRGEATRLREPTTANCGAETSVAGALGPGCRSRPAEAGLVGGCPVGVDDADNVAAGDLLAAVAEALQGRHYRGFTRGAADDHRGMEFRQPRDHQPGPPGRRAPARRITVLPARLPA